MTERRFFVYSAPCDGMMLSGEEYRHIVKVLRLGSGDNITLFCGDGHDYHCIIDSVSAAAVTVKVEKKEVCAAEPKRYITLFQAAPKGDKADFTVQKCTELGLSEIVFFDSAYAVKKMKGDKTDRFLRIAAEAAKQCGRASVPKISICGGVAEAAKTLADYDLKLLLNERERGQSMKQYLDRLGKYGRIALIIGSEGGFSEKEVELLTNSGASSVSLGARILRTETAAVAAAAIVMCAAGELE